MNKLGFTLIELLVVVLIIGILAAIALPQYQKSVYKSRTAQLLQYVRNLADAQELYYLSNSSYTTSFDKLDISFPNLPKTSISNARFTNDALKADDNIAIMLNPTGTTRVITSFVSGKYEGGAFIYFLRQSSYDIGNLKRGIFYCAEHMCSYTQFAGLSTQFLQYGNRRV
jgi:prepilin-type N-terminal cleavage/methylation domain-containing protein